MDSATQNLLLAQNGDDQAFAEFVMETQFDVLRFCRWQCRGAVDVDDLAQETFVRAYRGLQSYSYGVSCRSWLLTIARNVCADHYRKTSRDEKKLRSLQMFSQSSNNFSEVVENNELINHLPFDFREAFVLVRIMGLRYDEAAEILKCPRGTVQSRVARARQLLVHSIQNDETRKLS
jgi:RNA polymerase sigma-70 factor, ECF subfamily